MINSLTDFTKSAGLVISCPPLNRDANGIPVLGISTHDPNFRGSNKKKRTSVRCHHYIANDNRMQQGLMYRRQLLLASTSLPFNPQQMMMAAMPPPPNFANYHKLANAVQETQKFKNSPHSRPEINDVVSWPLKSPNGRSADELSGVVGVPAAQERLRRGIDEKEVVTVRISRSAALKQRLHEKEEVVVLKGIEVRDDKPLCFDVYIRLGQVDEELYLGTFSHMLPRQKQRGRHNNKAASGGCQEQKRVRRCCLRLGMNEMLIDEAESVIVKLVPTMKVEEDAIKVESIFIDYT